MDVSLGEGRDHIRVGRDFTVAFQRTLRVPEDGRTYPLPPGLGRLPIVPVTSLKTERAGPVRRRGGFAIPLHQREALWLAFGGSCWRPHVVQVSVGGVNAIDGGSSMAALSVSPQNYLVTPDQPWLDGINAGAGHVRQFVALRLNDARTIEAQLRGRGKVGGIQIRVHPPMPGRFPEKEPVRAEPRQLRSSHGAMGLGAGGKIAQRVYPDPYGLDTWDQDSAVTVLINILNSMAFADLAGVPPAPSPITAESYAQHGLPWFELYDERMGDVAASPALAGVVPTGGTGESETPVEIASDSVHSAQRHWRSSRRVD